jgi:hypothetical protein
MRSQAHKRKIVDMKRIKTPGIQNPDKEFFPESKIERKGKAGDTGLVDKGRNGFPVYCNLFSCFKGRLIFSCIAGNMNMVACTDKCIDFILHPYIGRKFTIKIH